VPDFWTQVLSNPPEEMQQFISDSDLTILACIKSLCVERYQIESTTQGDPHGLRFTFEFNKNDHFEDVILIKEFQRQTTHRGSGGLVSTPVPIRWKSKKTDATGGLLKAAVELYQAEETLRLEKADIAIDPVERESLWQYVTLQEKLDATSDQQPSFFNWFGYRGAVLSATEVTNREQAQNGDVDDSDEEHDDGDQDLDVEIFPGGDQVARILAEDLWPNVMDYFSKSGI